MKIFVLAALGVFAGGALLLLFGWLFLKHKLRALGKAFEALASISTGIPPFRVTLEPASEADSWQDREALGRISGHLNVCGYAAVGDYDVPELEGVTMRALHHPTERCFALITEHPEAGFFVDIVRGFTDGGRLTVTSAPTTGLDRPAGAPMLHIGVDPTELEGCRALQAGLQEQSLGREKIGWEASEFESVFLNAYTAEMNWRIERGGVTADEIRAAAEAGGQDFPDESAIEIVIASWKAKIEDFIDTETRDAFLELDSVSSTEWEHMRDRLCVVHEHADADARIESLAWAMVGEELANIESDEEHERVHDAAVAEIRELFADVSVREGFARAQQKLPAGQRFERVASLEAPWPADVYVEPTDPEGT